MANSTIPRAHPHTGAEPLLPPDRRENMGYQAHRETLMGFDWAAALRDLSNRVPEFLFRQFEHELTFFDRDGWRYLLPEQSREAHIVCLDARFGTTAIALSEVSDQVTVLHHDAAALLLSQRRAEIMGVRGLTTRTLERGGFRLPLADASVDAFVFHDPRGEYHGQARVSRRDFDVLSPAGLREIGRIVKPRGFVYLGLPNPLAVSRLPSAWRGLVKRIMPNMSGPGARVSFVKRALGAAGFRFVEIYPYLEEEGAVWEVLPTQGYLSVKDSLSRRERLKEIIFSPFGARHLVPAYGFVGMREPPGSRILDAIASEALGSKHRANECLRKYQILPGKVIFTLNDRVVVIPRLHKMLEGRRRDVANVLELSRINGPIRRYLPTGYRSFVLNGENGFAMSAIPGITLDSGFRSMSKVTREAAQLLTEFHRATAQMVNVSPERYETLCGWITERLGKQYPEFTPEAVALDRLLRARLMDRPFLSVWMHGDYKLENLVLNRRTLAIQGIIDWEHARRQGLPLLDLYYLFAYNRGQCQPSVFLEFPEWLLKKNFSTEEAQMLDAYLAAVDVPETARDPLVALFFVHHVAVRLEVDMTQEDTRAGMRSCLRALLDHLADHVAAEQGI